MGSYTDSSSSFLKITFIFRERRREGEREGEKHWLVAFCTGDQPTTQTCALMGNQTGDVLLYGTKPTNWATWVRAPYTGSFCSEAPSQPKTSASYGSQAVASFGQVGMERRRPSSHHHVSEGCPHLFLWNSIPAQRNTTPNPLWTWANFSKNIWFTPLMSAPW